MAGDSSPGTSSTQDWTRSRLGQKEEDDCPPVTRQARGSGLGFTPAVYPRI
jgi:hypothetical protein